jgi:Lipase (class 3)
VLHFYLLIPSHEAHYFSEVRRGIILVIPTPSDCGRDTVVQTPPLVQYGDYLALKACVMLETGLQCRIHGGLLVGLKEPNPHKPSQTMFSAIIESLQKHGACKKIFICGHSIGGGISSYVSLFLHQRYAIPFPVPSWCQVL